VGGRQPKFVALGIVLAGVTFLIVSIQYQNKLRLAIIVEKMASPSKRLFDPPNLSEEEKTVVKRLGKSHKITNFTSDLKIEQLKMYTFAVGIIDLLMEHGQLDMVLFIMSFLSVTDFVKLAAAANSSLVATFWNPQAKVFKAFRNQIFLRSICHDEPNLRRLSSITTGQDLLREHRLFQIPKLDWKIDTSQLLPNNCVTSAHFNPNYPILAVLVMKKIYILAYGGEVRQIRGQILYVSDMLNYCDKFRTIHWSPSGRYLLVVEDYEKFRENSFAKISVISYNPVTFEVNKVEFDNKKFFFGLSGMNTRFLWLDDNSFIFVSTQEFLLAKITLNENCKYEKTFIDLTPTLKPLINATERKLFIPFLSSLFVLPNPNSPYLFFLSSCPEDHQHHRIIYVDKLSREIFKIASLPGEVIEITVNKKGFFLLTQDRVYESFQYNQPLVWEHQGSSLNQLNICPFPEPFRTKRASKYDNASTKVKIIVGTSHDVHLFRSPCCVEIDMVENKLHCDGNKKKSLLYELMVNICKTSNLYVTRDYLYFVNKIKNVTHVFGLNHHFAFDTIWSDDWILPATTCQTWFHPKKGVFLRRKTSHFFELYLSSLATDEDRKECPEMDEFIYNRSVKYTM
jgi:hypothetical protein